MANVPETAVQAGRATALALVALIDEACARIPAELKAAAAVRRSCRQVATRLAPAARTPADLGDIAARLVRAVQRLGRAGARGAVTRVFYGLSLRAGAAHPGSASPVLTRRYRAARSMAAAVETAMLCEAFLADGRASARDRAAALEARARIAAAHDAAATRIGRLLGAEGAQLLADTAATMSRHLGERATSLGPVVRVETPVSTPSTAMAWRLYGDPARSGELLRLAHCGTPMFLPLSFEARSPQAATVAAT